ncbi:MAG TPA: apolipoprotein N-acyltransferase [Candidatus Omnitrophica bacterium]|nr:apolipoprotein N-acyltransferase [Candidatus Omnitrophota bacterium]
MVVSLGLALLSGFLCGLSFCIDNLSFLVWFSFIPFFCVINKKRKKTFFLGFVFGISFYLTVIFWLKEVTKLGLFFLILYLSLYPAFFSFFALYFLKRPQKIFTLSSLWVILEFLKENLFSGFGWANLGYSQYKNLYLIQVVDLFGTKFVSFFIIMVNVFLFESILRRKIIFKNLFLVISIFVFSFLYSFFRLHNLEESDILKISIIQPNILQELKWKEDYNEFILTHLKELPRKTDKNSLVVFPEASWPFVLKKDNFFQLKNFIKGIDRTTLLGAVKKENGNFYNTALLLDKEGNLKKIYRKINLVPFGEYVPFRKYLSFIEAINAFGDIAKGKEETIFSYQNRIFFVLICFEDIFPSFVRRVSEKSDFLISITNDAWFKGNPQARQHLAILVMRAIENRISVVRSANTGISSWVSFKGEIEKLKKGKIDVFFAEGKTFKILLNKKRSLYNKYGEIFVFLCIILIIGNLLYGYIVELLH